MFNWLANRLATRLQREYDAKLLAAIQHAEEETEKATQQRDALKREQRALVSEMEDMLEKFSRVVARQAMRRTRAMKQALVEEEDPPTQQQTEVVAADPRTRKSQLRAQLAARLGVRRQAEG